MKGMKDVGMGLTWVHINILLIKQLSYRVNTVFSCSSFSLIHLSWWNFYLPLSPSQISQITLLSHQFCTSTHSLSPTCQNIYKQYKLFPELHICFSKGRDNSFSEMAELHWPLTCIFKVHNLFIFWIEYLCQLVGPIFLCRLSSVVM